MTWMTENLLRHTCVAVPYHNIALHSINQWLHPTDSNMPKEADNQEGGGDDEGSNEERAEETPRQRERENIPCGQTRQGEQQALTDSTDGKWAHRHPPCAHEDQLRSHTLRYQSPEHAWFFSSRYIDYFLGNQWKYQKSPSASFSLQCLYLPVNTTAPLIVL